MSTFKFSVDSTRARILDCALELFRERGFAETTMRDTAAAAGVATGASYYYFRSKEEIVMAFYERASAELPPLVDAVLARERNFGKRLRGIILAKLEYFEPNRRFFPALLGHSAGISSPLSPFGEAARAIRAQDQTGFARARIGERTPRTCRRTCRSCCGCLRWA